MENFGTDYAISLHIYGYDHTAHASSVANEYEATHRSEGRCGPNAPASRARG